MLGMVIRADWTGLLAGIRTTGAEVTLKAPLRQSNAGGSGSFLALADDNRKYWVKTLNNTQNIPRLVVTEQLVGRVGKIIGGPTCEVKTVLIPGELVGWEFRPNRRLEAGIAHGSLAVEGCVETYELKYVAEDENAERHANIFAIYDLCWGDNPQWLVAETDNHRYYSHDHGHYFPQNGNWTAPGLEGVVDTDHELGNPGTGIDHDAVARACASLHGLTRHSLVAAFAPIPSVWPVSDDELETVGYFFEKRALQVAERLHRRFGRPEG
jgi:hypothetical protein